MPRERLLQAVVFTALLSAQFFLRALPAVADDALTALQLLAYLFARSLFFVVPFFASVALAQSRMDPGPRRWAALLAALGILVGLNVAFSFWAPSLQLTIEKGVATPAGLALENGWTFAVFGSLAVWYYESADRASRAARTLHEHQLACRGAQRWVAEMRLGALQARIDPRLLHDTLERAGGLYRKGAAEAQALIADLIDYLRLALPPARQIHSTVGRELALALAYERLLRSGGDGDCRIVARMDPAVADARFPPMVMQPLCEALLRDSPGVTVRLDAARRNGDARIVARLPATAAIAARIEAAYTGISPRFESVSGIATLQQRDGVLDIVLQVPYVPSASANHAAPLERRMGWTPDARMEPAD